MLILEVIKFLQRILITDIVIVINSLSLILIINLLIYQITIIISIDLKKLSFIELRQSIAQLIIV